ncbi:MAG: PAS domain-containing sensor histidine kinase [Saprospiraceae bacterium]|nr:PAS domain-containing sensor histidine kinase [Saprospiraceae bacterium]MDP4998219.1 PAS domain-containing sensor histidine kinase [Saprospiraceae bacterium]
MLKAIFNAAIDGIVTISREGIIETLNPAAARLFGYDPEEVIGRNVHILMPAPYKQSHDQYISNYLETGRRKIIGIGREVEGIRKDGSIFPIRLAVSEVIIDGRISFAGIIHDLSDVKAAEAHVLRLNRELEERNENLEQLILERTEKLANAVDRLLATNEQLGNEVREREVVENSLRQRETELEEALDKEKELNTLKSRFVSMASHEFRTPLSTILSSIELVEAYLDAGNSKALKHINRIKNSVTTLTSILNDFLSLSRLEEGKVEAQPERFQLSDFCLAVVDEMRGQLKRGQQLIHEEKNVGQEIFLDKKFLKIIFFNLISNAIKYSPEGKPIRCTTSLRDQTLSIVIQDEGMGIPREDQPHLFTRFFRAHNVENIQGTGLGLNIVKRYIELLNGRIRFESAQGFGTSFFVDIPLQS